MRIHVNAVLLACLCVATIIATTSPSEAHAPRSVGTIIECDMRWCRTVQIQPDRPKHHQKAKRDRQSAKKVYAAIRSDARQEVVVRIDPPISAQNVPVAVDNLPRGRVVDHPTGCPRTSFCGCGVAVKVFGRPVRELWLAANWFRFPRAEPREGMVAVRKGHVFYLLSSVVHGTVLAWDPNSGGHKTRVHLRSLNGYKVVNPRASTAYASR